MNLLEDLVTVSLYFYMTGIGRKWLQEGERTKERKNEGTMKKLKVESYKVDREEGRTNDGTKERRSDRTKVDND